MIGKQLKFLRERKQKSQLEVCNALNIEQSTLANYENDKRIPKLDILIKIAKYYEVSVDFLLGLSENDSKKFENNHYTYCSNIANRISDIAMHSSKELDDLKPLLKTEILSGYCTNGDLFLSDIYVIADFFGVSDEYILGGSKCEEQTYGKYWNYSEVEKFVNTFVALNEDNKDIIVGEMKKLLKEQRLEESIASVQIKEAK